MASPVYTPRLNNNDDVVTLITLHVKEGDNVVAGESVAEIETDKAVMEIVAEQSGIARSVRHSVGDEVSVGSILLWVAADMQEHIPEEVVQDSAADSESELTAPTAKAKLLLAKHKLVASDIETSGTRMTVSDIERHLQKPAAKAAGNLAKPTADSTLSFGQSGSSIELGPKELGMLRTVEWHRDQAVAAYMELEYDPAHWDNFSAQVAKDNKYMMSPLLALMSHRLALLSKKFPKVNSTILDNKRFQYDDVNLGFTIQADDTLYLVVVKKAETLSTSEFIDEMGSLQRLALTHKIKPENLTGATVGFSSMARWGIRQHIPVLAPNTSLMIAHTSTVDGRAKIGATYDHRVLAGGDVALLLQSMTKATDE